MKNNLTEKALAALRDVGCEKTTYNGANAWLECYGLHAFVNYQSNGRWQPAEYAYGFINERENTMERKYTIAYTDVDIVRSAAICMAVGYMKQHTLEYIEPERVSVDDIIEYRKYHGDWTARYRQARMSDTIAPECRV